MRSFTNNVLLSKPSIPSFSLSNLLQQRSLSFCNLRLPASVNAYFYRTRPKGIGAHNVIQGGTLEKKTKDLSPLQLNTYDLDEDEHEKRIETLVKEIKELFSSLGDGEVSPSPYDTAWVARIPSKDDPNQPQFPTTLEWVMKNQLEDGSWGDSIFFSLYDRLVCTLSCVITLTQWKQGHELIPKGLSFLQMHIKDLEEEKSVRTVGFEIIFPSMLNEAKLIGLNLPYDLPCIRHIHKLREEKMTRIPLEVLHSVPTTLLYSIEALEADLVQWNRILKLQSTNGSISDSPSATAATYLHTNDQKCLDYLTYIVKKFEDHAPFLYPIDTYERCWMIDTIQRLGIDHYFRKEIHNTLDFIYRILRKDGLAWGSNAPVTDIDDTCMGLRLLRLHGYPISSDILEYFKDDEGNFLCLMGETHKGISDYFSLHRFSQITFPGENILKQAKNLAEQHLMNSIKDHQAFDKWAIKKALHKEIEWALRNQWKMSLPRLETQEYINHYGENDVWIGNTIYRMYNINNPKYLELAQLEHNKLHAMHTKEANSILLWWNSYGFDDPHITKVNPKEIHLSICAAIYEPKFSAARINYTKWNCIESLLKNMFQSHESIGELKLFSQAIDEWKPSLVQILPTQLKRVFMGTYDTMNDLADEAKDVQGINVFPYLHDLRKEQVQQYLNFREAKEINQFKVFEEYVDQVKSGLAVAIRLAPAMLLMGDVAPDKALKLLDKKSTILGYLVTYIALLNLVTEERVAFRYYMKEQNYSEQDAKAFIEEKIDETFVDLTHEYLKPNNHVSHFYRRLIFEHGRIFRFFLNASSNDPIFDGIEKIYMQV